MARGEGRGILDRGRLWHSDAPVARCLKCGRELPSAGECPACARGPRPAQGSPLLQKRLSLERRSQRPTVPETPALERTEPRFEDLTQRVESPRFPSAVTDPEMPAVGAVEPRPTLVVQVKIPQAARPTPEAMPRVEVTQPQFPAMPELGAASKPGPEEEATLDQPRPNPDEAPPVLTSPALELKPTARPSMHSAVREHQARPAPLWRRLCAWAIDLSAIVSVVALYLLVASLAIGGKGAVAQAHGLAQRLQLLSPVLLPGAALALVLAVAYTAGFSLLWQGRTIGRRLLGIRLVDQSGLAPTPGRALLRAGLAVVSAGLCFGGFWMALFDRRGQTLHDKLTSTFVVLPS